MAQQISTIRDAAQATANTEVQKAIDSELEKSNIKKLIEASTQKKVDAAVEDAIRKDLATRLDAIRTQITRTAGVSSHVARLSLGSRIGLDALLKDANDPDADIRAYARASLSAI